MITTIALGSQFGILTPLRRLRPVISDLVNKYDFQNRCEGIKTVEIDVAEAAQQLDSIF